MPPAPPVPPEDDDAVVLPLDVVALVVPLLVLPLEVVSPVDELVPVPVLLVVTAPGLHSGLVLPLAGQQMSALPPRSFALLQTRPSAQSLSPFLRSQRSPSPWPEHAPVVAANAPRESAANAAAAIRSRR